MYQKISLIGRLGDAPTMRYTQDGVPVASFPVATDETWIDKQGQKQSRTTWFRVTCWNKQAETVSQYLGKGHMVFVEGKVRASAYADREGKPAVSLEVTPSLIKFLGSPRGEGKQDAGGSASVDGMPEITDQDIPF